MPEYTDNDKKIAKFAIKMFYLGIALAGIALVILIWSVIIIPPANAQEYNEEYDNCEIRQFRENAYTPFRIAMTHEPALKQTIEQSKNDPASRLVFDQFEQETDEAPTYLAFSTNSTDDWIIKVNLEYKSQSEEPRIVLIDYDSNNLNLEEERIYHEGYDFCIVYLISARPPPKIPTADEILGLADKIQQENFEIVAKQIEGQTASVIRGTDVNTVFTMLLLVMIIVIISAGVSNRRATKKLKTELAHERSQLATERENSELARKNVDHHMNKFDNFIKEAEIEHNSILLDARKIEGKFDKNKDDVYAIPEQKTDDKPTATILDETKPESTTEKITRGIKDFTDSLTKKEQPPPRDPELDKQKEHFKRTVKTKEEMIEKYSYYHNCYKESPSELIGIQVNAIYELLKEWDQ